MKIMNEMFEKIKPLFTNESSVKIETISAEKREEALEFVKKNYDILSDRKGLEDMWEKFDKLYNNISVEKYYNEGWADLFSPEIRKAVTTVENFIDESIWSADPNFKIKSVGGKTDEKKADIHQRTLYWQMQKIKFRDKLRKFNHNLIRYGFGVAKVIWAVKEKERIEYDRTLGKKKPNSVRTYDNLDFQNKNIRNIYFDYFCEDYKNLNIIIERIDDVDWNHLKANEKKIIKDSEGNDKVIGIYDNLDEIEAEQSFSQGAGSYPKSSSTDEDRPSYINELTGLSSSFRKSNKKIYEILEAWCNFDLNGDGIDEECIITIVNKKWVIRCEPNPYDIKEKPYIIYAWDEIEGTCIGMGIPQACMKSQIALNDFLNQVMDNITAILNNMKIVDTLAEIPELELKSRPNGVIHSKGGVDAVKNIDKPVIVNEGIQAIAMMKEDIRTNSKATTSMQGLPARYGTTAAEYNQQTAASARDLFAKLRSLEDNVFREFLTRGYKLDIQFMTRTDYIRIIGEDALKSNIGENWTVEDLILDCDFIPLGLSQMENKVIVVQQLINFFNLVAKLPPGIVRLDKLIMKIWIVMGFRDDEEIVYEQPEPQLIAPEDENILLSQNENLNPHVMDNAQRHLMVHQKGLQTPAMQMHIQKHMQVIQVMQQGQMGGGLDNPNEQPQGMPNIPTEQTIAGGGGNYR